MTNRSVGFVLAGALFIAASPIGAVRGQQEQPVLRAFEHYERIRAARLHISLTPYLDTDRTLEQ